MRSRLQLALCFLPLGVADSTPVLFLSPKPNILTFWLLEDSVYPKACFRIQYCWWRQCNLYSWYTIVIGSKRIFRTFSMSTYSGFISEFVFWRCRKWKYCQVGLIRLHYSTDVVCRFNAANHCYLTVLTNSNSTIQATTQVAKYGTQSIMSPQPAEWRRSVKKVT
jgi:hypothetical protein